jgi:AraC-like DNA-binding protein
MAYMSYMNQQGSGTSTAAATNLLAKTIQRITTTAGDHQTAWPELTLHRRNAPTDAMHCIYTLGLVLTAQGSKQILLGDTIYPYGPGESMMTTIDLPVVSHVTRASSCEPYLGVMLRFDANALIQAASEIEMPRTPKDAAYEPISIQRLDLPVLDALYRLIQLLDEPNLLPQLAPLVCKEITIRLLAGPHASHLWHLATAASPKQQIVKAVSQMKLNFNQSIRMDELAGEANMSPSTFRQHFRTTIGMSPVQFQKLLRLQEARQLMLNQNMSAGSASAHVGYESASQFNREYRRLFGAPPHRDIRKMLSQ